MFFFFFPPLSWWFLIMFFFFFLTFDPRSYKWKLIKAFYLLHERSAAGLFPVRIRWASQLSSLQTLCRLSPPISAHQSESLTHTHTLKNTVVDISRLKTSLFPFQLFRKGNGELQNRSSCFYGTNNVSGMFSIRINNLCKIYFTAKG